jgi:hypothetical protein
MVAARAETQTPKHTPDVLSNIEATEPLLFSLAKQLLSTEKDRWNVIIGDDAGGRLPTRFVHDILKQDGRDFKTFYVASSGVYRHANGSEPYEQYFKHLQDELGEPLRPLVVTESVGTGSAVDFIRTHLEPVSSQIPEIATVAVSSESEHKVDYAGGIGAQPIDEVWHAYESPPPQLPMGRRALQAVWRRLPDPVQEQVRSRTHTTITPVSVNETVGIRVDIDSDMPVASRDESRDGDLSTQAYRLMDQLAAEAFERTQSTTSVSH